MIKLEVWGGGASQFPKLLVAETGALIVMMVYYYPQKLFKIFSQSISPSVHLFFIKEKQHAFLCSPDCDISDSEIICENDCYACDRR